MTNSKSWVGAYSGRQVTRRKFLGGAAAGAGAAALIACGSSGSSKQTLTIDPNSVRQPGAVIYKKDDWKLASETDQAVAGGTYPGRESADLTSSWDPFLANVGTSESFADAGYEYLVRPNRGPGIEPGSADYNKILGNLAEAWEVSNDSLTYTFTMRQGVKFHPLPPVNGREMTMEDWRTTYERFIEVGAARASLVGAVDKVEYPDSRHMVIKMKEPYAPFMRRMYEKEFAFKIVPKELTTNPDLIATTQIGTNYRIVDKVQPSITRDFKRFDGYWAGKPLIERWHYPIITEAATAYSQFLAQNIISYSPSARDALTTRKDAPNAIMVANAIDVVATPYSVFGKIDLATSAWKDPRVRIALRRAVDYDSINDFLSNKEAFSAVGIDVDWQYNTHAARDPGFWLDPRKNELGDASKNYFFDVAEAKSLVQAAGFPSGFDIQMNILAGSNTDIIDLINGFYKKTDFVRVNVVALQRQEFYDNTIYSPNFKGMTGTSSGSGGATDQDYILAQVYKTGGPQASFPDPKMDEFVLAQRRAVDFEKRAAVLKDWQRYAATVFYHLPTRHVTGTWSFEWPWLHNTNQQGHLQWLDQNMPKRNG